MKSDIIGRDFSEYPAKEQVDKTRSSLRDHTGKQTIIIIQYDKDIIAFDTEDAVTVVSVIDDWQPVKHGDRTLVVTDIEQLPTITSCLEKDWTLGIMLRRDCLEKVKRLLNKESGDPIVLK